MLAVSPPQPFSIGFVISLILSAIRTTLDALPSADSLMLGPRSEVMSLNFHDQASSTNWYSCQSFLLQYYSVQKIRIIQEGGTAGFVSQVASPHLLQAGPLSALPPVAR